MTCAVSCTASPKNNPAASGQSAKKYRATYGSVSIPAVPNATTLATATAVSACVAAIAGDSAPIAVTPHIDVPAARRLPSLGASEKVAASRGMKKRPAPTDVSAAGTANAPSSPTSVALYVVWRRVAFQGTSGWSAGARQSESRGGRRGVGIDR
eukprot:2400-Pelagococcus_subviridis.AAC.1